MCCAPGSARATITLPSAESDVLIALASERREPLLVVRRTRSEPARSTSRSLPRRVRDMDISAARSRSLAGASLVPRCSMMTLRTV